MLYMVDDEKYFSSAPFSDPLKSEHVQDVILTVYGTTYTSAPNTLLYDDGLHFRYLFVQICEILDLQRQKYGTRHHSA